MDATWASRSGFPNRFSVLYAMFAVRLACREPCSVYPIAPVYSLALSIKAVTSGSRLTSSSVTSLAPGRPVETSAMVFFLLPSFSCSPAPDYPPPGGGTSSGRPRRWSNRRRLWLAVAQITDRGAIGLHPKIGREFHGYGVTVDIEKRGMQPADSDNPVALLQLAQHFPPFALLRLLRA